MVVVDDSIVRGTTMRKLVKLIRSAGAAEVHLRIASPPVTNPCFYGIDTPVRNELIASSHTVEEIATYLRVDSLAYLSLAGLLEAAGDGDTLLRRLLHRQLSRVVRGGDSKDIFDRHAAGADILVKPLPPGGGD